MRFPVIAATLLAAGLALAGCSSSSSSTRADAKRAAMKHTITASNVLAQITATVTTSKLSGTVTAANDPNHLLGRPGQYMSKVTFTDSRIKAADVDGTKVGDVERGGAVEVFADPAGAEARAKYIQAIGKSMPVFAEYDYVHGAVLVRVSHYLTPTQAAGYKTATSGLG
ncbi:MAG: hypothetical protein JF621_08375 [Streptomyces turgidiscabies]|nr:hypothetical protein [Streptomyces turgidiscabies]